MHSKLSIRNYALKLVSEKDYTALKFNEKCVKIKTFTKLHKGLQKKIATELH